jgi:hypothetical protein
VVRAMRAGSLLLLFAIALALTQPCRAQSGDLSAETAALIFDLLAPYRDGKPPAGVDPAVYRQAIDIIRKEKLLVESRPRTPSTGLLTALSNAIGVGTQAAKAPEQMGALRDAAGRGDEDATTKAIEDVYKRLGWKPPEAEAMAKLRQASVAAVAGRVPGPASFERKTNDYTVTVVNDRAQAAAAIDVAMNGGPDGKPARLVLEGKLETQPNLDGSDLEAHAWPDRVKTYDAADLAKVRTSLNGGPGTDVSAIP